jgi:hypothetical protein
MTSGQCIGYLLNQTSAITNICSSRIYNGNRPDTTTVPCINFYEISGGQRKWGIERVGYSINCRATTAETALTLARKVDELFNGVDGFGTYADWNGFGIARASTRQRQGLIPEPDNTTYNAPVDVYIVFSREAMS